MFVLIMLVLIMLRYLNSTISKLKFYTNLCTIFLLYSKLQNSHNIGEFEYISKRHNTSHLDFGYIVQSLDPPHLDFRYVAQRPNISRLDFEYITQYFDTSCKSRYIE